MKFFLPLLLVFLFKQVFPQSETTVFGNNSEPRFMAAPLGGLLGVNFENTASKNQYTLGVKNIWSQENINVLSGQWAHQKSRNSNAVEASWLSHPFWKNTSLGASQRVQLGEHTLLAVGMGAQHQKWNHEWSPWEWRAALGTAFAMDRWTVQCSSYWQPNWNNGKVQNKNAIMLGAQVRLAQNVQLLASTQWRESLHYKTQCTLQWQNEKQWQFTAGMAWPAWMWTMGVAWKIQNWSQGIWMDQSAWTRPSLEYRMRYEK
jgi:hypothetical protein